MLDLDSLAEKQASTLAQDVAPWRAAMWSSDFQKVSQNMSDGEVESLVGFCPSVAHLNSVLRFLLGANNAVPPYTLLLQEAERSGLNLIEWISRQKSESGPTA